MGGRPNARGFSLPELLVVDVAVVGARHEEGVLEVDLAVALAHVAHEVVVAAHHELADLDVVLLHGDLRLDEGVRVVDDGQEDVHQDEEHEEDVRDEENRPQESVGGLAFITSASAILWRTFNPSPLVYTEQVVVSSDIINGSLPPCLPSGWRES